MAQGRPSKASLILLEHDVTVTELAEALEVSVQAVSQHLNGQSTGLPVELLALIQTRVGTEAARKLVYEVNLARRNRDPAA